MGHFGQAAQCLDPQSLHVDLFVRWIERAALDPAVTCLGILDQVVLVGVGRSGEPVSLQDRLPVPLDEAQIAAGPPVVSVGDDIKGGGVGAGTRIWIVLEPWYERGALRDLVRDLAIIALKFL